MFNDNILNLFNIANSLTYDYLELRLSTETFTEGELRSHHNSVEGRKVFEFFSIEDLERKLQDFVESMITVDSRKNNV